MDPKYLFFVAGIILTINSSDAARLSNSKLIPPDGMLCGPGKMGFKFNKAELVERFRAMADHAKDPVEVVQIYVAGSKLEALCLYDPAQVEDKKAINAAVTEFEDGERGVNITASAPLIWLGNWIPYLNKDSRGEPCVTSVKADSVVFFQSEVVIEVVAPANQAGAKIKISIHCEMPRPQSIDTDLKVHRVDHLGSAVGEIPFQEHIQLKFVHPSDPSLSVTEVSLDEPVRLVLWKVRQESDRSTLRTSIVPMHCELYSDSGKASGITFVQNSCQARTPADIVTAVKAKKTEVEGLEFREIYWTDFNAFRFDGSNGLLASCTVRICSKTHLGDCQNKLGANGLPCFDEGDSRDMLEYPAITGDNPDSNRSPEAPNQELELLRLAYPRKYIPYAFDTQRSPRSVVGGAEDENFVTIQQRLNVLPSLPTPARLETRKGSNDTDAASWPLTERKGSYSTGKKETCFQNYVIYAVAGVTGWLLLFALIVICMLSIPIDVGRRGLTWVDVGRRGSTWVDVGGRGWTRVDAGGRGWTWVDVGGRESTWVDVGGRGWTWVDVGGRGWTWVDVGGRGWTRVDVGGRG
ncbi:hypothetical protein BV898_11704 [Hypsibius exemplaris]|uniref:ZP domain-containing protein n=1 Tax=Hypsibius exemplaris TaxID=2072580 RepID=A0A1W0WFR8_HYPEX|nr:hypothetical protein BV898_11704 [Hypsibius exemplaris]